MTASGGRGLRPRTPITGHNNGGPGPQAPVLPSSLSAWFTARGWTPRRHQLEMVAAARTGRHALLVAPTGAGKTLAGFLATLADLAESPREGLHTIYVSRRSLPMWGEIC